MFKKLFGWLKGEETVAEILTPPATSSVAESIKAAVNNQITDSVTAKPKKKNTRRKSKSKRPTITEGKTKGGNGVVKQQK